MSSRRWCLIAVWILLAASLVDVIARLSSGQLSPEMLFQADAVYLPALYRDIIEHGGRWLGWRLTPSPYFFPDMAIYFAWNRLLGDFRWAIVAMAVSQVALLAFGGQLLARATHRSGLGQVLAVIWPTLILGFYAAGRFEPGVFLLVSAHHLGAALAALFALGVTLTYLESGAAGWAWALAILCASTAASDAIFFVFFSAPACASVVALWWVSRYRQAVRAAAVIAAASLGGWVLPRVLYKRFRDAPPAMKVHFDKAGASLYALGSDFWSFLTGEASPLAVVWCGAMLMSAGWAISMFRSHRIESRSELPLGGMVGIYLWAMVLACCAAATGTGNYGWIWDARYLLSALFLPPVALSLLGATRDRTTPSALPGAVAVALVALAFAVHLWRQPWRELTMPVWRYTSPLAACLDANSARFGLGSGLSDYWNAKPVSLLSHTGLQVVQVERNGRPYHWINNIDWYLADAREPRPFNFVLTSRLDVERILERFGRPAAAFECGEDGVFVYRDDGGAFNSAVIEGFARDLRRAPTPRTETNPTAN